MKNILVFAAGTGALALAAGTAFGAPKTVSHGASAASESSVIENQFICAFDASAVPKGRARAAANAAAGPQGGRVLRSYNTALRGFSVRISPQGLAAMQARNPHIAFCEPDRVITLAPPAGKGPGGGGGSTSQETPWGITRVGGFGNGTGKTAWIIDSGVDLTHPDLNVDGARSRSFLDRDSDPNDANGHGTHVAGTIGAINNGFGVVGVAQNARVVAVRVLDRRGSGSYSGVIAGVDYVAANGKPGDVANMSLGGPISDALDIAVINAAATGVKFALAAGNDGADANNSSPARANGANIYTISASDSSDRLASFSNYGNPPIEYAEPGVSISSTWKSGGYNTISGTSMAAPHAAGLLLLLGAIANGGTVSGDPDGNPDQIGVR